MLNSWGKHTKIAWKPKKKAPFGSFKKREKEEISFHTPVLDIIVHSQILYSTPKQVVQCFAVTTHLLPCKNSGTDTITLMVSAYFLVEPVQLYCSYHISAQTVSTILRFTIFWQWRKHADAAFKHVHTLLVFACARAGVAQFLLARAI